MKMTYPGGDPLGSPFGVPSPSNPPLASPALAAGGLGGMLRRNLLLNGNLALKHRVNQLKKWNTALNNAIKLDYSLFFTKEVPRLVEAFRQPSVEDAWLSGFTDAVGCFSVKIGINKRSCSHYVRLLFILDQKNGHLEVFNKVGLLFSDNQAVIRTRNKFIDVKNNLFQRLTFCCNDNKKKIISSKIIEYFNNYKLKTSKKESFRIWTLLDTVINNQQLGSPDKLKEVRKLRHNMNYFTIENSPIGYASKS